MELKRVLLATLLSFVVLLAYQSLFLKPVRKAPQGKAATSQGGSASSDQPPANPDSGPQAEAPAEAGRTPSASAAPAAAPEAEALVADTQEREVVVETPDVRAVFSTRGAELKSWVLKAVLDDKNAPVDLIPRGVPPLEPRAFALIADDAALTERLRSALYRPSHDALTVARGTDRVVFEYADASGLAVRKEFEIRADNHPYLLDFTGEVRQGATDVPVAVASGAGLGDTDRATGGSFFSPAYYQKPQAIFFQNGKVSRLPGTEFATQSQFSGRFAYIGADDHYFLGALLPGDRDARVDFRRLQISTPLGPRELVAYEARLAGGPRDARFYLGPKRFDQLARVNRDLTRVINFGMFAWLVVPLLRSLNWINGFVGNYGWSIIILTVLINAAMFPLRHKSVVSMRKLQDLQPEVKTIQDRYAKLKTTDPQKQKMNVELMNLYRERGVNPASGCLPMLLTFPVLFAFYALLSQAIELRGAPFFGWITDLSKHDPWYITPVLMGATMIWQQKITPSTADPMQQKMMMYMPLMFMVMFLWAPSGLVIYWFVSNLWAIGQQYLTNYLLGPPKTAARPPAERKTRQAAGA